MIQKALTAGAAAFAIALSSSAGADIVVGAPIVVPNDNTVITLEFLSFEAAYTGELSLLGAGTDTVVARPASDTGLPGFGQQTFINRTGVPGAPIVLDGEFNAGDVLHFAYRVFEPADAADVLRTDDPATADHFAWDAVNSTLHVEDLRPDHPWYDADYDDIIVRVNFSSVPGPASALALAMGACAGLRRRRRAG